MKRRTPIRSKFETQREWERRSLEKQMSAQQRASRINPVNRDRRAREFARCYGSEARVRAIKANRPQGAGRCARGDDTAMNDVSMTYIRVTMEKAIVDIDRADELLRKVDHDGVQVTAALWRLDFVRKACERVLEEITDNSGFGEVLEGVEPTQAGVEPRPAHNEEAA